MRFKSPNRTPPSENESDEEYNQYYERILGDSHGLPPVLYTLNSEDVEFRHIFN